MSAWFCYTWILEKAAMAIKKYLAHVDKILVKEYKFKK